MQHEIRVIISVAIQVVFLRSGLMCRAGPPNICGLDRKLASRENWIFNLLNLRTRFKICLLSARSSSVTPVELFMVMSVVTC